MPNQLPGELIRCALRHAPREGRHETSYPPFQLVRCDRPSPRIHSLHQPSLCMIAQGTKVVTLGDATLRYTAGEFLYSAVELPLTGEVLVAAPRQPYLCLVLAVDPALVFDLVAAGPPPARGAPASRSGRGPAIFVGRPDPEVSDAFLRLLRCLDRPGDVQVLAPMIARELTYRLLHGPYGEAVRQIGVADSQTQRIAGVLGRLKRDFAKPLRSDELARAAGMSVSSFHAHFRSVTTLSPLQYQKQLRLAEARRLLHTGAVSAADAGYQVGYLSPSQFSREYARAFGAPPRSDARAAHASP